MLSEQTGTTRASIPITELQKITENQQKRTADTVLKEALALSSEKCNSLIEEQTRLIKSLKEQELKFTDDLKKETTEATERAAEALGERVREITLAYRQVMEKEMDEVRKAAAALTKALEAEPLTKKEVAENLRTSIEKTSEELTEYCKLRLADSLSDLDVSLKETKEKMEELGEGCARGKKFSRVTAFVTPALLFVAVCVAVAGLFV